MYTSKHRAAEAVRDIHARISHAAVEHENGEMFYDCIAGEHDTNQELDDVLLHSDHEMPMLEHQLVDGVADETLLNKCSTSQAAASEVDQDGSECGSAISDKSHISLSTVDSPTRPCARPSCCLSAVYRCLIAHT